MSHLIWIYAVCKFNYYHFWCFNYKKVLANCYINKHKEIFYSISDTEKYKEKTIKIKIHKYFEEIITSILNVWTSQDLNIFWDGPNQFSEKA